MPKLGIIIVAIGHHQLLYNKKIICYESMSTMVLVVSTLIECKIWFILNQCLIFAHLILQHFIGLY